MRGEVGGTGMEIGGGSELLWFSCRGVFTYFLSFLFRYGLGKALFVMEYVEFVACLYCSYSCLHWRRYT